MGLSFLLEERPNPGPRSAEEKGPYFAGERPYFRPYHCRGVKLIFVAVPGCIFSGSVVVIIS